MKLEEKKPSHNLISAIQFCSPLSRSMDVRINLVGHYSNILIHTMIQFFPLTHRNTIDELFTANDIFLLEMQEYIVEKLLTAALKKEKKKKKKKKQQRRIFVSESRKKEIRLKDNTKPSVRNKRDSSEK